MANATVNGVSLEYVEQGEGEPLVLAHGSASDYRTWEGRRQTFAGHYRVVAYSRRYHWPNAPIADGADYVMAEHVEDLEALLRALAAAPAHLVGHSYGAFVCLLLAIRSPELVRSLVLTEPPAITLFVSDPPKPPELLRLLVTRPRTAIALVRFAATGLAPAKKAAEKGEMADAMRIFGTAILGRAAYDRLSAQRQEQVRANAIRAEFLGSGFPPLAASDVQALRMPTLLLCGAHSAPLFGCVAARLAKLMPNAELLRIEHASHIVHEDNATAYEDAVLAFLSGRATARA